MISQIQMQMAQAVYAGIYQDFLLRHLSGNLMGTMEIVYTEEDAKVRVPAVRYDLKKWNKDKIVVSQPWRGSYASAVNDTGGFSRTHQEYAERACIAAVRQVMGLNGLEYTIEER